MAEPEVLITSEPSKLPGEVAALLDPAVPLPDGVRFFEKRYEFGEMLRNLMIAIGLGLASLIVIPFGIASLFNRQPTTVYSSVDYLPLGFGLVLALASWMMFVSLGTSLRLRNVQKLGQCTRRGTFLTPTSLIQASENDTTVIPPSQFRGIEGSTVKYFHNKLDKSYRLPSLLINATPPQLQQAIAEWAATRAQDSGASK